MIKGNHRIGNQEHHLGQPQVIGGRGGHGRFKSPDCLVTEISDGTSRKSGQLRVNTAPVTAHHGLEFPKGIGSLPGALTSVTFLQGNRLATGGNHGTGT